MHQQMYQWACFELRLCSHVLAQIEAGQSSFGKCCFSSVHMKGRITYNVKPVDAATFSFQIVCRHVRTKSTAELICSWELFNLGCQYLATSCAALAQIDFRQTRIFWQEMQDCTLSLIQSCCSFCRVRKTPKFYSLSIL